MIGHFPYKSCMDVYGCALSSMVGNPGIAFFSGALCATGTLCALCPSDWILGQGHLDGTGHPNWLLELNPKSTFTQGLFVEILATMLLGLVFLLVTDPIAGKQFAVSFDLVGGFFSNTPLQKRSRRNTRRQITNDTKRNVTYQNNYCIGANMIDVMFNLFKQ